MLNLQDRLKIARTRLAISQAELAEAVGMKQPSYYQLESGKTKKTRFILEIAKHLKVNPDWLVYGKGEMEIADNTTSNNPVSDIPQFIHGANLDHIVIGQHTEYPLVEIEYMDAVACCGNGYANENYPAAFTQSFTVEFLRANGLPTDGKGLVLMHACGDSMGNTIPAGTVILVNKKEADFSVFINNKIYVFNVNGEMMCKRAIKNIDGSILLKSDSVDKSTFPDWKVTSENADNINIFGRVRYVFMQV